MFQFASHAISRGFTANQVLRRLSHGMPQAGNFIFAAQAAGYTADQILSRIAKDKKNHDPDNFLTEQQKELRTRDRQKRNRALAAIGALGTIGALAAGAYHLYNRNPSVPIVNPQVLPAIQQSRTGIQQPTINIPNPQIGYNQRLLPGNPPPQLGGPQPQPPQIPVNPSPQPTPNSPPQNQPIQSITPVDLKESIKNQRDPMKSIQLVSGLKQDTRFKNMIDAGHDDETTAELLKMVLPRQVSEEMKKVPGGIQSIVEDYRKFLKESESQEKPQSGFNQGTIVQNQTPQPVQNPIEPQPPIQQPEQNRNVEPLSPEITRDFSQPSVPLAMNNKGQIGEVTPHAKGVSNLDIDGKSERVKDSSLTPEPEGIEEAVRRIVKSIPEKMKSTQMQSAIYIPEHQIMITQFYDGKYAWYKGVPEDIYRNICMGNYTPVGEAITGIAEYSPDAIDSRGAGFDQEIKKNPTYSKGNKGNTWGYANNEYSLLKEIQPILHKVSKERYDKQGKLLTPKKRKSTTS